MGLPVLSLLPNCHAARAGVLVGDEVVKVNDCDITSVADYVKAMSAARDKGRLTTILVVKRGDELLTLEMIAGRPAPADSN